VNQQTVSVIDVINGLLERNGKAGLQLDASTPLYGDENALNLDSLQTAELSAILEDELGSDPFSAGLNVQTVGEILDFYAA
jgi:acyl carrier protein